MPDPSSNLPAPIERPSPVRDPDAVRVPTSHQLPAHRGKVARVGDHVAAISADLREWVELRIDLAKAEVGDKIDETKARVERAAEPLVYYAVAGVVALYLLGFALAALAWGLAMWLGDPFWGFLIVTVLLAVVVGTLGLIGKRKQDKAKAVEARLKAPEFKESTETAPLPPTRRQLQDLEDRHARQTTT
ncbi:MAG TPA: phage holin family protein [Rubricoccaceae bacterium]|jgi:hypothetical protein